MNYFFDTNAILVYLREHKMKVWLDENYDPLGQDNTAIISVVVLGELESIALRNNWGQKRIAATTSITNSRLITSDKDFLHLKGKYLDLILIEI